MSSLKAFKNKQNSASKDNGQTKGEDFVVVPQMNDSSYESNRDRLKKIVVSEMEHYCKSKIE